MASKGGSRHVKRLAVGPYSKVSRKTAAYLAKPRPGRHSLDGSVALLVVLRDKLGLASNSKEAKRIIVTGQIEVNGAKVTDEKYPVGFGDVIGLIPTGESYSIGIGNKGAISVEKLAGKSSAARTLKVVGKYAVRGNKIMARLLDGTVLESGNGVRVNDSVVLEDGRIKKTLKLENGAKCLVIKGTHASETGKIKEIVKGSAVRAQTVRVESGAEEFETLVDNVMVVGA
jgi:small subunit ribosomal protein S4e